MCLGQLEYVSFNQKSNENTHKFKVMFLVVDQSKPFLEFYCDKNNLVSRIPLEHSINVYPSINLQNRSEFCVQTKTQIIKLVCEDDESMNDWIKCIKMKLIQMKIINYENFYSNKNQLQRGLTSSQRNVTETNQRQIQDEQRHQVDNQVSNEQFYEQLFGQQSIGIQNLVTTTITATAPPTSAPTTSISSLRTNQTSSQNIDSIESDDNYYEQLFNAQSMMSQLNVEPNEEGPPPYQQEQTSPRVSSSVHNLVPQTSSQSPRPSPRPSLRPSPQTTPSSLQATPSSPSSPSVQISLRESQVLKLQKEMTNQFGVRISLRKKDLINSIALINYNNQCFIGGWKSANAFLHNKFHIGDRIKAIAQNDQHNLIESSSQSWELIKNSPENCSIELIIERIPYGRVYLIKKDHEKQDLGLIRDKLVIKHVIFNGMAQRFGLNDIDNDNWCLTEVNNRSLNLFSKEKEIETRLNSIGKEISLIVQSNLFIKSMKKQLKQTKSFKQFLIH